jgi:uncharacterized phosphosugar-binding protein
MAKLTSYSTVAIENLNRALEKNRSLLERLADEMAESLKKDHVLYTFGSGHSSIFSMELYHRAGGPSFVIPLFADYLLPTAGPPVVRVLERTPKIANVILKRAQPNPGDWLFIASQSGVNAAVVDFALDAKAMGLKTVAFTSLDHSSSVPSRHPSGKKLFEVCDEAIDICGFRGDAAIEVGTDTRAGPLSSLTSIFLAHTLITTVCRELEGAGISCVYTSVNTPEGEVRNKALEKKAAIRDPLLRE